MKIGRNDPCPCGTGAKYKKCCLPRDEARASLSRSISFHGEEAAAGELEGAALLQRFRKQAAPDEAAVAELLKGLLPLPPGAVDWAGVLEQIARHPHLDLAAAYRTIDAGVPHEADSGLAHFYTTAAGLFAASGRRELLAEVAGAYSRLEEDAFTEHSLSRLQDCLVLEGLEAEALALAGHFLPALRVRMDQEELEGYLVSLQGVRMLVLRAGQLLRTGPRTGDGQAVVSKFLWKDIAEEEVLPGIVEYMAETLCNPASGPPWKPGDLGLPRFTCGHALAIRQHGLFVAVAREAWTQEQRSPGATLWGLLELLRSANHENDLRDRSILNLHDYLVKTDLDQRILRYAVDDHTGVMNHPLALLVCDAGAALARFLQRHQLLSGPALASVTQELRTFRSALMKRWSRR